MTTLRLDHRGLPLNYPFNDNWEITPRELKGMLHDPSSDVLLLDCRTADEHAICRIEPSVLAPMGDLAAMLDDLREHQDRTIVIHCHHGHRSLRAAAFLRQQGFEDVRSLAGGIDLWSVDIDPAVPRY